MNRKINKYILSVSLLMIYIKSISQRWPIKIYLPQYSRFISLSDNMNLNDTIIIADSKDTYFKFIFFNSEGKSYCEVYKDNKLYEKGYYESSMDTLKQYSSPFNNGKRGKISILKYFEPLKDGWWIETQHGELVQKLYSKGEQLL